MKAHSNVLAAASKVFRSSLKPLSHPTEQLIVVPGVEVYILEIAVQYAYTGEIAIPKEYMTAEHLSKILNVLMDLQLIVYNYKNG